MEGLVVADVGVESQYDELVAVVVEVVGSEGVVCLLLGVFVVAFLIVGLRGLVMLLLCCTLVTLSAGAGAALDIGAVSDGMAPSRADRLSDMLASSSGGYKYQAEVMTAQVV